MAEMIKHIESDWENERRAMNKQESEMCKR